MSVLGSRLRRGEPPLGGAQLPRRLVAGLRDHRGAPRRLAPPDAEGRGHVLEGLVVPVEVARDALRERRERRVGARGQREQLRGARPRRLGQRRRRFEH